MLRVLKWSNKNNSWILERHPKPDVGTTPTPLVCQVVPPNSLAPTELAPRLARGQASGLEIARVSGGDRRSRCVVRRRIVWR